MATIGARFACKANWPFASSINLAEPESCQGTAFHMKKNMEKTEKNAWNM